MQKNQVKSTTNHRGRSRWSRVLVACLCVLMVTAPVTSAFALKQKDIVSMKKLGLDDAAIKGAIDTAGDELMLSAEDLKNLKKNGISDGVIEHLRKTGHVKGSATAAPGGPGAPGAPGAPAAPPAPGGPAPSGDLTDEQKQAIIDEQKQKEEEIKLKAQELIKAQEDAKLRTQKIQTEARRLPQAFESMEDNRNMEAARICLGFLNLNPDPNGKAWYDAKYCLAKSLYQEGILSGASRPLLEVLLKGSGADRPHFKDSFRMLEGLSSKIGYRPPLLAELTKINEKSLNKDFRNDFNYFMGKFFYDYNNMETAKKHLNMVTEGAQDYPEAQYLIGVATLGEVKSDNDIYRLAPQAAQSFQNAILAGEKETGGNEEIIQMGYLGLARIYYELGFYNIAMFNYQKLPENSSRNAEAMYEIAWTHFLKNDYKRALGVFQQLNSPYYSKWFYPDLGILEATVYLNLCDYQKSKLALSRLQTRYLDKRPALQKFMQESLKEGNGPAWLWNSTVNYYKGGGEKKYGLPRLFADAVMDDLNFYNIYRQVQVLQKERTALKANIGSLGDLGKQVLDRVEDQLRIKITEGGTVVQQRLAGIDQELNRSKIQAFQISFDIDKEEKDQIQARLNNKAEANAGDVGTTLFIVADDWHPWPFEGEYWLDEINNYRSNLRTECVAK